MSENNANLRQEIEKALNDLRSGLRLHGGDVELVEVDEDQGIVKVRLHGVCVGCPMSEITLKEGIEATITAIFPQIKQVVAVE